jgi:hypothetical protein
MRRTAQITGVRSDASHIAGADSLGVRVAPAVPAARATISGTSSTPFRIPLKYCGGRPLDTKKTPCRWRLTHVFRCDQLGSSARPDARRVKWFGTNRSYQSKLPPCRGTGRRVRRGGGNRREPARADCSDIRWTRSRLCMWRCDRGRWSDCWVVRRRLPGDQERPDGDVTWLMDSAGLPACDRLAAAKG